MIPITREIFDLCGPFYLDDFPIDNQEDQDRMFELFKQLPESIQGEALMFGCGDSVFRDNAFVFLVQKHFNCSTKEFYKNNLNRKIV